jgi:hypothetical protein
VGEIVTAPTPPGWYPDPSGSGRQMYWDGRGWAAPQGPPAATATATKKSSNGGKVALVVVGIVVVLFAIGKCGSNDNKSSSSSSSSSRTSSAFAAPAATPSAQPTPTAAPAGSAVRDGKFEFRVLDMRRAAQAGDLSNQFEIVQAQGEFIILTLSVKNIGDEPQSYFGDNQQLIDSSGRQYSINSTADMWMNSGSTGDINPGNQIQVTAAFDVPPGTVPTEIEVHDSMFSGGAKVRL